MCHLVTLKYGSGTLTKSWLLRPKILNRSWSRPQRFYISEVGDFKCYSHLKIGDPFLNVGAQKYFLQKLSASENEKIRTME